MSVKKIALEGIGPVTLVKLARNRSIRLSVTAAGVRVSMPRWTPFSAGIDFAHHNADWIVQELTQRRTTPLESGQAVGKVHYVRFEQVLGGQAATSRVTRTEVVIRLQPGERSNDPVVQLRAAKAAARALKREAESLLPPRLAALSARHGLPYTNVAVKSLKRRWGSCNTQGEITLNFYLMELPWKYIDYVLCHELTHTKHMNHGPGFWHLLTSLSPDARALSKQLRSHQPEIGSWRDPTEQ
jgi:predicted metal-dependent hydrolase